MHDQCSREQLQGPGQLFSSAGPRGARTQRLCCPIELVRPVALSWPCLNTCNGGKDRRRKGQ